MNKFELLKYIHKYTVEHGHSPSMREIGCHFNIHNINVSNRCIKLKKQGYLVNNHKKARSLVLTTKGLNEIGYLEPPEVTIFNDKAYVRLTEYQDLQNRLSKRICELQADLSKSKTQIEKLSYAKSLLRDIFICRYDPCLDSLMDEAKCYVENVEKETSE